MRRDLERHIQRTGNRETMLDDPEGAYRLRCASELLDMVESALRDENVPEDVTRRVLGLIIYGSVPSRAEVEMRQMLTARLTDDLAKGLSAGR